MGWERRHGGRRYLYRNRRVNGERVREYLGADDARGAVLAHDLNLACSQRAEARRLAREVRAAFRTRIDDLLDTTAVADTQLRTMADGVLYAVGYHKHHRGEWRMTRELAALKAAVEALKDQAAGSKPLVWFDAPATDAEAIDLFAKARTGDTDARARVGALIRERRWVDWLGDLGRQATRQLVRKAAGGDPVWEAGITEKANALRAELLGATPTVLDELLVRRVVNGWIATYALELELTIRPPLEAKDREYLDRALSRAQKRYSEAICELARVRRLHAPAVFAQVNVAATQSVVNHATHTTVPPVSRMLEQVGSVS